MQIDNIMSIIFCAVVYLFFLTHDRIFYMCTFMIRIFRYLLVYNTIYIGLCKTSPGQHESMLDTFTHLRQRYAGLPPDNLDDEDDRKLYVTCIQVVC